MLEEISFVVAVVTRTVISCIISCFANRYLKQLSVLRSLALAHSVASMVFWPRYFQFMELSRC